MITFHEEAKKKKKNKRKEKRKEKGKKSQCILNTRYIKQQSKG